jgi:deoxyribonuclease-4
MRAFERADGHAGEAIQIFTTNGSQWQPRVRDAGEVREFHAESRRRRVPVLAHDSYLINLASPDSVIKRKSVEAFSAELDRCEALGIDGVVMHPGAHLGEGTGRGISRVGKALKAAIRGTRGYRVRVLIELTAGQGTCLGSSFDELGKLLDAVDEDDRTGVCFDTCHAYAAGYDWRRPAGYEAMWRDLDRAVGLRRVRAFHLNDSKRELGSRVDRHMAIGEGHVGDAAFQRLVRDPRFQDVPAVLELPPDDVVNGLRKLKAWRARGYPRRDGLAPAAAHRR